MAIWISGSSLIRLIVPPFYEYPGGQSGHIAHETLALFIRCKMAQDKYYKKLCDEPRNYLKAVVNSFRVELV
jgi:hypothetical protein